MRYTHISVNYIPDITHIQVHRGPYLQPTGRPLLIYKIYTISNLFSIPPILYMVTVTVPYGTPAAPYGTTAATQGTTAVPTQASEQLTLFLVFQDKQ